MASAPLRGLTSVVLMLLFVSPAFYAVFAQNDAYYSTINTSSAAFVDSLKSRVRSPYTRVSYDLFDENYVTNFASRDTTGGQKVVTCVYSGLNKVYTPPFQWNANDFSREHTWCQSWMPVNGTGTDQYADYHHLFPTNQNFVNGVRSNHPLGIVTTVNSQYLEGKLGTNSSGQTVYEPRNSHKGDAARALLYMSVRYDGIAGNWTFDSLNLHKLPTLSEAPQSLTTLLDWHRQDPPDEWEVERNDYIESIQKNRNPFVDHPEYVNYINFGDLTKASPSYSTEPTNFPTGFTASASGTSITLSWTDATGAQLPQGYLIEAFFTNSYIIPIDGSVITADSNLADGRAFVYVNQGSQSFTFSGLNATTTYYFRIHSYNGSSTAINYKLGASRPSATATTGSGASPLISVSPVSFYFTATVTGANSAAASYTVSGSNLTSNITITPPAGFQVSLSAGSGYVANPSTLTITQSAGTVAATTIYVRFSPGSANGFNSANVTNASSGAATVNVAVSGNALAAQPTVQPSVSFGTVTASSAVVNFSGGNGSGRVIVARASSAVNWAPADSAAASGVSADFSAATDQGSGNKVVYAGTGSTVTVSGLSAGTSYHFAAYEYNTGTGTSYNYLTSSPGTASTTTNNPNIAVADTAKSFGVVALGDTSTSQSTVVSGSNLTQNITLTPPAGFIISLSPASGYVANPATLTLTQSGGTVAATTVYIRYVPAAATGVATASLSAASTGAAARTVSLSAYAKDAEPTVQSAVSLGSITGSAITATLSGGNGGRRIVVVRQGSAVTFIPTDTIAVSGVSSVFTSATDQGSGNKVVYDGTGGSVTVTGLTAATQYYFASYEYNIGSAGTQNYLTAAPGTANAATTAGSASLSASSASLAFGVVAAGDSSSSQSFTVSGSNLTGNVTVTPASGYVISLSSGSGYVANPSALTIVPASGSVSAVPVYVRFAPGSASAAVSGTLTVASSGATTQNVALSGYANSAQPTVQSSVTLGTVTNATITATLSGGNGGRRIVVVRAGSAVSFVPTDTIQVSGVSSSFTTATDQGSGNKIVYDGTGTTVTVTGLAASTTYHFAAYEYNLGTGNTYNYLTASPGTSSAATAASSAFNYSWVAGSTNFGSSASWSPARSSVNSQDVLNFNTGDSVTVSGVTTQTISQLNVLGTTKVNIANAAAAAITIGGGSGTDFQVASGARLYLSGTSACSLLVSTGATATISGVFTVAGGAHRLTAVDSASIKFLSGAVCSTGTSFSGNLFGNTALNSVSFESGATYQFTAGSNPFGATAPNTVVRFQPGSWFKSKSTGTPAFSNRTYANFEFDPGSGTVSGSGINPLSFDTLRVLSGTLNLPLTGGISIKNQLSVATGATLTFLPASADTLYFNGTTAQSVTGSGTITLNSFVPVRINNAAGVTLQRDLTLKGNLILSNGRLTLDGGNLLLDTNASVVGTPSASAMVVVQSSSELRKVFTGAASFTFPVGSASPLVYTPVDVTLSSFDSLAYNQTRYIGVKLTAAKHGSNYSPTDYLNRYWSFSSNGIYNPLCSLTCKYDDADIAGSESALYGGKWNGTNWLLGSAAVTGTNKFSVTATSATGVLSAAAADYVGNAAMLNLTAVSEGLYDQNTGLASLADTLRLYASSIASPGTVVDSSTAVMDSVSLTGSFFFRNISSGNYYIKIKGRNTLETWTRAGGEALLKGARVLLNLSADSSMAYGSNLLRVGNKFCLYAGDINNDGIIDLNDMIPVDNDNAAFITGFVDTDLNGDGIVDLNDMIIVDNNNAQFISVQSPAAYARPVTGSRRAVKAK